MAAMPLIAIEVVVGFLVPIGWAVWELIALRRDKKRGEHERAAPVEPVKDIAPTMTDRR